jgi:hypothetical protein
VPAAQDSTCVSHRTRRGGFTEGALMHSNVVWIFSVISLLVVLLFPLYTTQYQYPAFSRLVKESVNNEAIRLALHMSSMLATDNNALSRQNLPDMLRRQIDGLREDAHFLKIRVFSPGGEILYSTHQSEVGRRNEREYFRRIVDTGKPQSVEVPRNTESLDRQLSPADVVETYVPMTRGGKLIGVLEIYYDITEENARLRRLIRRSSSALFAMMLVLVGLVVVSAARANKSLQQRRRVEEERGKLILQLQDALASVKTLKGLLPICAWCKKIRDDDGYYTSVEQYIESHLDAKVTHGICQECDAKLREELAQVHDKQASTKPPDITPAGE